MRPVTQGPIGLSRRVESGDVAAPVPIEARETATFGAEGVQRTGERMVSVLFADVRGYTEMIRSRPPAEMHDRLAALQRWALMAVERHHGLVDKFAGDAIMATNVSGAHVDHTEHALDAAFRVVDHAAELKLSMGVGIAVGRPSSAA